MTGSTSALVEGRGDVRVLGTVLCVLGKRGDPEVLDALVPFLGPEFEREPEYPAMTIQGVAADAIGKIGMAVRRRGGTCPPHIGEALVRSDHPGASSWIVCAIGAVG